MLPCTEASDIPGLYSVQLVPSHRRELQTAVSTSAGLTSALANTGVGRIVLAPGTYILNAELIITRSVVLEAAVAGSVVLDAQSSSESPRRVLNINPGSLGVVRLIGLNITRGYVQNGGGVYVEGGTVAISSCTISGNQDPNFGATRVRATETSKFPIAPLGDSRFARCLQGGGVAVLGGAVSIVNSQIYSNTAASVRAHLQKFPSPPWETHVWLDVCREAVSTSLPARSR